MSETRSACPRRDSAGTRAAGGARSTFNVLWPGGEEAPTRMRAMVMEAAALLRRLGMDVRVRMPAPDADWWVDRWADTVVLIADADGVPPGLLTGHEADAPPGRPAPVLLLDQAHPGEVHEEAVATGLRVMVAPDAARLASAWLMLAEATAPASGGDERLYEPSPSKS